MVTSVMGSVRYLDSGASFHMSGNKELFSDFDEKDLQIHIKMGDYGRYSVGGINIVTFQRDSDFPLTLKDGMYVPDSKKNLVSVAMLEDHGMM